MNIYSALDFAIPWQIQATILAGLLLLFAGFTVRRKLESNGGGVIPDEGVTLRNVLEVLVETLADLGKATMGEKDYRTYFPLVGAIFTSSWWRT